MLGYADLHGRDAETGQPTHADDLVRLRQSPDLWQRTANMHPRTGEPFLPSTGAPFKIFAPQKGPGHEFDDVVEQLCGPGMRYRAGQPYPAITCGGYVANYLSRGHLDPSLVMRCFTPEQVPVITTLAREYAVCDRWFSSLPGPTWPNRFFVHAATSGGLDDSPSTLDILFREVGRGFQFEHGTIFDRLGDDWMVVHGDPFPHVFSLAGMLGDRLSGRFVHQASFERLVSDPGFSARYVFIEPNYGRVYGDYGGGSSQHATDDVTAGERLIKDVYEAIRRSPHWNESALVITYDEHGGFFDHVAPPAAVAPGDDVTIHSGEEHGFDFRQLGPRVPAVVVSPLVPRGTIDHREYDHASVPATLVSLFDLPPDARGRRHLTDRAASTGTFEHLFSLPQPRTDRPDIPDPASSGVVDTGVTDAGLAADPTIDPGVRGFLYVAFLRKYGLTPEMVARSPIAQRVLRISTRVQARDFLQQTAADLGEQ
jgi:phospholipase C